VRDTHFPARYPPGICEKKYPKKNDDKTSDWLAEFHLQLGAVWGEGDRGWSVTKGCVRARLALVNE
jgi:hypothetical protein